MKTEAATNLSVKKRKKEKAKIYIASVKKIISMRMRIQKNIFVEKKKLDEQKKKIYKIGWG